MDLTNMCGLREYSMIPTGNAPDSPAGQAAFFHTYLRRCGLLYVSGGRESEHFVIAEPFDADEGVSNGLGVFFASNDDRVADSCDALNAKGFSTVRVATVDEAVEAIAERYGDRAAKLVALRRKDTEAAPEHVPTKRTGLRFS